MLFKKSVSQIKKHTVSVVKPTEWGESGMFFKMYFEMDIHFQFVQMSYYLIFAQG